MKKILITAGCIVVSVMSASKAAAANFSQFFVFGDSLSDTGNTFAATSLTGNPIPVRTTTLGQPAYFNGRFSNGPIWVDYFGEQIGKQPTPFLQSPLAGTQGGVNYAFGGAETGVQTTNVPVPGILGQVGLFSTQPNVPVDSNAIYSILGGGNDYTSAFTRGVAPPNVSQVVGNLTASINQLAQKNAKNFLVFNLPDIGDTPLARANNLTQPLNALVQQHNSQLATALDSLRTQRPDLNIYSVDFNSLFKTVRSNPGQFGFTNVNDACLTGNNALATNVCSNPNEYVFFDDVHPSSAAHKLIANAALASIKSGNKSIPEPSVVLGLLALAGLGAKRVVKRKSKKLVLK